MLPMPATLDADLADDVVPGDADTPVSLSMTMCMNVVLLIDSDLHKSIFTFLHREHSTPRLSETHDAEGCTTLLAGEHGGGAAGAQHAARDGLPLDPPGNLD